MSTLVASPSTSMRHLDDTQDARILSVIEKLHRAFLASGTEHNALQDVLEGSLDVTNARLGWIAFSGTRDEHDDGPGVGLQLVCFLARDGAANPFDTDALDDPEAPWSSVVQSGSAVVRNGIPSLVRNGVMHRFDSFLGVPVVGTRQVVALLALFNRPGGFDESLAARLTPMCVALGVTREAVRTRDDVMRLQRAAERRAEQAAASAEGERVRVAQLEAQLQMLRRRELEATRISEAYEYVAASRSLREAVRVIAAFLPAIFGERAPHLLVPRAGTRSATLDVRASDRSDERTDPPHEVGATSQDAPRIPAGTTLRSGDCRSIEEKDCWALKTGQAFVSESGSLRCRHTPDDDSAWVCVPLVDGVRSVAVLSMPLPDEGPATRGILRDERHRRVASLSDQARQFSSVLSNLRLRKTLEEQATQDPLTGALNRRQLEHELRITLHRHERTHAPFALLVLDVDHFKLINDQFGHERGDRVLAGLAQLLRARLRTSDVLARVGGEEFVVVVRDAQREDAIALAESLRAAVEHAHLAGDVMPCTCSIGVAHVVQLHGTVDDVMRRADQALYQAKTEGRNRVVVSAAAAADGTWHNAVPLHAVTFPGSVSAGAPRAGRSQT